MQQTESTDLPALAKANTAITVRELIARWGARGRGSQVVDEIHSELKRLGLDTEPSFEYGSLDSTVRLVERSAVDPATDPTSEPTDDGSLPSILNVGKIQSSRSSVETVKISDDIASAQTKMIRYDYSQLPVVDDRGAVVGLISWETIAQKRLSASIKLVSDCLKAPLVLRLDDDLLRRIPQIIEAGCVIVLDDKDELSGIVTTADLSHQFNQLAEPFLLLGQCEQELRRILDSTFDAKELKSVSRFAKKLTGNPGASGMTFGEIQHFLKVEANWAKLDWQVSREQFIEWLDAVRQLRNNVAHFSQDEEVNGPGLYQVRTLIDWLRQSHPVLNTSNREQ